MMEDREPQSHWMSSQFLFIEKREKRIERECVVGVVVGRRVRVGRRKRQRQKIRVFREDKVTNPQVAPIIDECCKGLLCLIVTNVRGP
jgi:hypothetical protein